MAPSRPRRWRGTGGHARCRSSGGRRPGRSGWSARVRRPFRHRTPGSGARGRPRTPGRRSNRSCPSGHGTSGTSQGPTRIGRADRRRRQPAVRPHTDLPLARAIAVCATLARASRSGLGDGQSVASRACRSTASSVSRTSSHVELWFTIHSRRTNRLLTIVDDKNARSPQNMRASALRFQSGEGLLAETAGVDAEAHHTQRDRQQLQRAAFPDVLRGPGGRVEPVVDRRAERRHPERLNRLPARRPQAGSGPQRCQAVCASLPAPMLCTIAATPPAPIASPTSVRPSSRRPRTRRSRGLCQPAPLLRLARAPGPHPRRPSQPRQAARHRPGTQDNTDDLLPRGTPRGHRSRRAADPDPPQQPPAVAVLLPMLTANDDGPTGDN